VIAAHLLTADEKMTANRLVGVVIGLTGVVLIIGPDALTGLGADVVAQFAVLGAAVCYSVAGVFGRRFRRMGISPLITATGQVSASTVMLIPLAILADRPWRLPVPAPEIWGAILGLALISTALAYIIFFRVLGSAGVTNIMLVTFLIPVSAILLGVAFLGEHLEIKQFAGMGLIGLGAAIDGRLPAYLYKKRHGGPARTFIHELEGLGNPSCYSGLGTAELTPRSMRMGSSGQCRRFWPTSSPSNARCTGFSGHPSGAAVTAGF
jgi:drug/metabolite transporter (DMT)-like permease